LRVGVDAVDRFPKAQREKRINIRGAEKGADERYRQNKEKKKSPDEKCTAPMRRTGRSAVRWITGQRRNRIRIVRGSGSHED
jgi:hypothetical protein